LTELYPRPTGQVNSLNLCKCLRAELNSQTTTVWSESFGCGWWLVCKAVKRSATIRTTLRLRCHCCYCCIATDHRNTDRSTPTSVIRHSATLNCLYTKSFKSWSRVAGWTISITVKITTTHSCTSNYEKKRIAVIIKKECPREKKTWELVQVN